MKRAYFYETELGRIGIAENGAAVTNVFFKNTVQPEGYEVQETALLNRAAGELREYFAGKRDTFDIPLAPEGSAFEKRVWNALLEIPYGQTRSYAQIAARIGNPRACRAVGRANGRNPISIFIPCHRVIGTNGTLTGYAGGLDMKKILLQIENSGTCREV